MNKLLIGYGVYALVSAVLYVQKIRIFSFQFNPFGVSTTHLNSLLERTGRRFPFFSRLGRKGSNLFGWASIVFTFSCMIGGVLLVLVVLGRAPNIFVIFNNISFWDSDFDSVRFWIVVVGSIFIHEFLHGVVAGAEEIPIKTVGVLVIPTIVYAGYVNIGEEPVPIEPPTSVETDAERLQRIQSWLPQASRPDNQSQEFNQQMLAITGAGLYANVLLAVVGLMIWLIIDLQVVRFLITSNLMLIGLNLIPIPLTDGGKLFKVKVEEIFPAKLANIINTIFGKYLFYFLIIILI